MGIFGAVLTAVSGLQAQSYALENISGNIANSQTAGYKRVDTSFVDLVTELPAQRELGGSVAGYSRLTNTLQGDLRTTGVSTNMALSGEGYFVVQERIGTANNRPAFGSADLYTRRGDFTVDSNGYLVNGAGFYLKGSSIDPVSGQVSATGTGLIQISSDPLPARVTKNVVYSANLPSNPATALSQQENGSALLVDPPATTGPTTVSADDQSSFVSRTISGGSVVAYDQRGTPVNVQIRWGKVSDASGSETWNAYYLSNSTAQTTQTAWTKIPAEFQFGADGRLTAASPTSVDVALAVDGVTVGNVKFNFGKDGLTQYASSGGLVQANSVQQDGYASGSLSSLNVSNDGRISGTYSNGQVVPVAEVAVAQFSADNALKRRSGGTYEQTLESGLPLVGTNGAAVLGGLVEGSNTDVADEFAKMIVTQQAYSANTRVVTTSQQMLSDALNMVR